MRRFSIEKNVHNEFTQGLETNSMFSLWTSKKLDIKEATLKYCMFHVDSFLLLFNKNIKYEIHVMQSQQIVFTCKMCRSSILPSLREEALFCSLFKGLDWRI